MGLNTQSQDHAMCPVSFKAMKTIARSPQNLMPPLVFSLDIFSSPFSSFRIVKLETPLNCMVKTKFLWPMPECVRHRLASSDLLIRKFHSQVSPTLSQNAPFSRVYVFFHHVAGTVVSDSCFFLPSTTTSTIGHTQESTFLPDTTSSYMKRFSIFVSLLHFPFVYLFTSSFSNPTKFGLAYADLPNSSSSSMQLNSHMSQPLVLFNSHVFLSRFLTQPNGGLANIRSVL